MTSIKLYRIFGAGVDFECYADDIHTLCADIFENPRKYCECQYRSEELYYYKFTRNLWVEIDGNESRLPEIASSKNCFSAPGANFTRVIHNGKVYYISDKNLDLFNAQCKAEYVKAEAHYLIAKSANAIRALLDEDGAKRRVSGYVYSLLTEAAHCCRNWLDDNKEQA